MFTLQKAAAIYFLTQTEDYLSIHFFLILFFKNGVNSYDSVMKASALDVELHSGIPYSNCPLGLFNSIGSIFLSKGLCPKFVARESNMDYASWI